jgi:hypothetical protein
MKPYLHLGHVVVVDNFFPSVSLALDLYDAGTYIVATIRSNRIGLPAVLRDAKRSKPTTANRFTYSVWQHSLLPNLTFTVWRDRATVLLISTATNPNATSTVSRLQKVPSVRVRMEGQVVLERGQAQAKLPVVAPQALCVYQERMDAVDRIDQHLAYSKTSRSRTRKYWKVAAFGVFDLFVHNAYVLFKLNCDSRITPKKFRLELAHALIGSYASGKARSRATAAQMDGGHLPECVATKDRKRCKNCGVQCPHRCVGCDAFFCCRPDRNCFHDYHKKLFYSS